MHLPCNVVVNFISFCNHSIFPVAFAEIVGTKDKVFYNFICSWNGDIQMTFKRQGVLQFHLFLKWWHSSASIIDMQVWWYNENDDNSDDDCDDDDDDDNIEYDEYSAWADMQQWWSVFT